MIKAANTATLARLIHEPPPALHRIKLADNKTDVAMASPVTAGATFCQPRSLPKTIAQMSLTISKAKYAKPTAYNTAATTDANQTIQPTTNAASTDNTFLANVYVPPDSGNRDAISAKLSAVKIAMTPLAANAINADGP